MLSRGDDYPIHQTPEPIAFAGTDRNFYDRYFFNGYSDDGELFFGAALGVYPQLNIMDAAFAVRIGGRQYNLHASRHLGMERMETRVGPIAVEVIEPLRRLRVLVDDVEHGIAADLVFEGRHAPFEEPRVVRRNGPRLMMDYTRMTQIGGWSGWLRAGGHELRMAEDKVHGTRDRSWGIRQVGERDPQALAPAQAPQFHWVWFPAIFADRVVLFYVNEDGDGRAWNQGMVMTGADGHPRHFPGATVALTLQPGTRWPARAVVEAADAEGGRYRIEVTAGPKFFMSGLGYLNPEWAHGVNKGPLAVGYDEIDVDAVTRFESPYHYVQTFARLTLATPDGRTMDGVGVFETLSLGRHAPLGLAGLFDAP